MSATKKILIAIFVILLIGVLAFLITWGVINFNKVKDLMSGTGIYNKTDIDNAYNDGYNTALKDKDEWDKLLNSYKDTITVQTDTISQLNSEKSALDKSVKDYQTQVSNLTEQRDGLQTEIDLLNEQIDSLNGTITDKDGVISDMTAEKQALIEEHTKKISSLNAQITNLNAQIEELNTQIQVNVTTVASLNDRIAELQGTIAKYQEFIAQFETEDKAVVTFEFAGSVYSVQVVDKGGKVVVETPTSSEYIIFNGWTLNGEAIDLTTYTVTGNVRIIADCTYKYVVTFVVDDKVKSTQVIEKGNYVTETPTVRKTGYTFKYWTIDGENEVHFEQLPIIANTTFIAKFNALHNVDFVYENGEQIINTKKVENGTTTTAPRVSLNDGDVLNGWRVNGNLVEVGSYVITADTVFVADITYKHTVVFMVGDTEYNVQFVQNEEFATALMPNKDGYKFVGWSIDGINVIDVDNYPITKNVTFTALFSKFFDSSSSMFGFWKGYCEEGRIESLMGCDYVPLDIRKVDEDVFQIGCVFFEYEPTTPSLIRTYSKLAIIDISNDFIEFDAFADYEDQTFIYTLRYDADLDRLVGTVQYPTGVIYHIYFVRQAYADSGYNWTSFNYSDWQ